MLVRAEQWIKLIQTIAEKSDYEVVVLDLGDQMQGLFEILSLCDRIYMLMKPDGIAMAKTEMFEKNLMLSAKENVLQKIIKCRLPPLSFWYFGIRLGAFFSGTGSYPPAE